MKRLFTVALCTISTALFAQTDPLRIKLDNVFANINKTQIPTGFLEEYGNPLLPLDVFNGVLTDSNKVNTDVWRQAFLTLHSSRIYGTNPLPQLTDVNSSISAAEAANNTIEYVENPTSITGAVPVTMLYAPYNYLRPDAIEANLLYILNVSQQLTTY